MNALAIVSLRTEGPNPACDDRLEIAVAPVEPFEAAPIDVYPARVRSTRDAMPVGGVWLVDAMDHVRELTRGCTLAAWDASATRSYLDGACHVWDLLPLELAPRSLDLRSLTWPFTVARGLVAPDLAVVAETFEIPFQGSCALDEARVVAELYRRVQAGVTHGAMHASFSPDERAILDTLVGRLDMGRRQYGTWRVDDGRNNPKEALAEVMDALHYCAAELVRLSKGGVA